MLPTLVFLGALIAPAPPPTPAPAATPLKTIAHLRATPVCTALGKHANDAITNTVRNDEIIAQSIGSMRSADLRVDNAVARRGDEQYLVKLLQQLGNGAHDGLQNVVALRALADKVTDPDQKAALLAFANSLGGALALQQKSAHDIAITLARIDTENTLRAGDLVASDINHTVPGEPSFEVGTDRMVYGNMPHVRPPSYDDPTIDTWADPFQAATALARETADHVQSQQQAIGENEATAAEHVVGAVAGC